MPADPAPDPDLNLAQLQRWMQGVITAPAGVRPAVSGDRTATLQSTDLVVGTENLDSDRRLAIYSHAYIARLLEVLQSEFPALHHALGPELFLRFATDYLRATPPHSDTLGLLGAGWPDYLEMTRPSRERRTEGTDETPDWTDFLIDLARLERVYAEVFDGPGLENQTGLQLSDLAHVAPDEWPELTFSLNPSVVLLALKFPVHDYITAVRRAQSPEFPDAKPTYLVVSRQNFVVRRIAVSLGEFAALRALQRGEPLHQALAAAETSSKAEPDVVNAEIERWFQRWGQAGYFQGVITKASCHSQSDSTNRISAV